VSIFVYTIECQSDITIESDPSMSLQPRIERAMQAAVASAETAGAPPQLAVALKYATFPGGARIRPRLCLAVAGACGDSDPALADAGATAIELLHCASLVHDDLPCFDDAATRRGKPSVHCAFGEPLAVLTGDALIVLAFETLARGAAEAPHRLAGMIGIIGRAAGTPLGIVAGQAWETEPDPDLVAYHKAKTASLFAAATLAGAYAAGAAHRPWLRLGELLGEAYQVADDIRDVVSSSGDLGKPVGRDEALGRPSAARQLGVAGAIERLDGLVADAVASIPDAPGSALLRSMIRSEAVRFLPKELSRAA
jgi:geranylgeranyl diphosphate synthase type II